MNIFSYKISIIMMITVIVAFSFSTINYYNNHHLFAYAIHIDDDKNNVQNSTYTNNNNISEINLKYEFKPFLSVNGTDYIDILHNDTLSLEKFTILSWFKTNKSDFSEPAHIVNKGGFNTDEKGENMNYGIWISEDGEVHGGFETDSGEDFKVFSKQKYNDDQWHFVLLSFNGTLLKLDINGKEVDSKKIKKEIPDINGEQPLRIGANSLDKDKFFTGSIDEVRIYDRGLTEEEIQRIYQKNDFNLNGQISYLNFGIFKSENKVISQKEVLDNVIIKNDAVENKILTNKELTNEELSNEASIVNEIFSLSEKITNKQKTIISKNKDIDIIAKNKNVDKILADNINNLNKHTEKDNQDDTNFVFVASGDWDCNTNTVNTVNNISVQNPDLVVSTGDMSYDDDGSCFFETLKPIISKLKISLGNHDTSVDGKEELQGEYESYFELKKPFYSFDYHNAHFIMMDSNQKKDSIYFYEQYGFVENDLKKTENNSNIDWTVVVLHEPFYTNPGSHSPDIEFAKMYHPLFDKYGVDLVLAGHNHWYERTLPLKFNKNDPSSPFAVVDYHKVKLNNNNDNFDNKKKIVKNNNGKIINFGILANTFLVDKFDDSENPTFITIGTGGRKQHNQDGYLPYITNIWDNGFGFLKITVTENTLFGEFYANEIADKTGKKVIDSNYLIRDKFTISKNNSYKSNT